MNDAPLRTGTQRELPIPQIHGTDGRKGQAKKTRPPLSGFARLTLLALIGAAIGVLVGVVEGLMKSGHLFVPPLVVGTIYLASAGLIATRIRWMPAVGTLYAIIMLLGAATLGASSVFLRLTHPADVLGFIEIWIQMTCTLIAAVAGIAATVQQYWITRKAPSVTAPVLTWGCQLLARRFHSIASSLIAFRSWMSSRASCIQSARSFHSRISASWLTSTVETPATVFVTSKRAVVIIFTTSLAASPLNLMVLSLAGV